MNKNLFFRGNEEYRLLRRVNTPILFLGVPFKVSITSLFCIIFSIMTGFFLNMLNVPGLISISICIILLTTCTVGVRYFYRKYGVNGYAIKKRESVFPDEIKTDKSISYILKKL